MESITRTRAQRQGNQARHFVRFCREKIAAFGKAISSSLLDSEDMFDNYFAEDGMRHGIFVLELFPTEYYM